MKKVRFLDEPKEEKALKPIEFTYYLCRDNGWLKHMFEPKDYVQITYLGRCKVDGDMFLAKNEVGSISIYKGHLNDGIY